MPLLLAKFAIDINLARIEEKSDMPTRNISLTREQDAFVENLVKAGEYQNASEAMRDAIRALQQRRREDALKLRALKMQIEAGVEALERGDFIELDERELESYLDGLTTGAGESSP
jgi:antitoxin ParD1/3/4